MSKSYESTFLKCSFEVWDMHFGISLHNHRNDNALRDYILIRFSHLSNFASISVKGGTFRPVIKVRFRIFSNFMVWVRLWDRKIRQAGLGGLGMYTGSLRSLPERFQTKSKIDDFGWYPGFWSILERFWLMMPLILLWLPFGQNPICCGFKST